jgi:adenosylhomocysteine nucleosidase
MNFMKHYLIIFLLSLIYFSPCQSEEYQGRWSKEIQSVIAEKGSKLKIGLISAKPYEQGNLKALMHHVTEEKHGNRSYYKGSLFGIDTVLTLSRVGKVASAMTATELIVQHDVDLLIFFGTAGAIHENVKRGDVVIGQALLQYDMDASPFVPPFTIPMIKIREFCPDPYLIDLAQEASEKFLSTKLHSTLPQNAVEEFKLFNPSVHCGVIASGDSFISSQERKNKLKEKIPGLLCVEMEGAAVAQVAYEYNIPCLVIRVASDDSNAQAYQNFMEFLNKIAPVYAEGILENLYLSLFHETIHN